VATYELKTGNGKVIMLGIYGQNLIENPAFNDFFDKVLLPRAMGEKHDLNIGTDKFSVYSELQKGAVSGIVLDEDSKSLKLTLEHDKNTALREKTLAITMPKKLLDAGKPGTALADFSISADGIGVGYSQSYNDVERGLQIIVPPGTNEVVITGTQVVPEFSSTVPMLLLLAVPLALWKSRIWRSSIAS